MLSYESFKNEILLQVNDRLEGTANATLTPIRKNNDTLWDGLIISTDDSNISPAIYLNSYYDPAYLDGESISSIADDLVRQYRRSLPCEPVNISFFTDFDKVKDMIVFRIVNRAKNETLLEDVPHIDYLDLSVTFLCLLSVHDSCDATILIHNSHLELWNTDADELYEIAIRNTPKLLNWKLRDMKDIIEGLTLPEDDLIPDKDELAFPIYVLSNTSSINGAACILYEGVLAAIADRLYAENLYIIPSSIHEVLVLPQTPSVTGEDLDTMICQVNASAVSDEEILSDHVYYYCREDDLLSAACPA